MQVCFVMYCGSIWDDKASFTLSYSNIGSTATNIAQIDQQDSELLLSMGMTEESFESNKLLLVQTGKILPYCNTLFALPHPII